MERQIRFFVIPGSITSLNVGDVAMMLVMIDRLSRAFPDAMFQISTSDPDALQRYVPAAIPAYAKHQSDWFRTSFLPLRGPALVFRGLARFERELKRFRPGIAQLLLKLRPAAPKEAIDNARSFYESVQAADALVFAGMGALNEEFKKWSLASLALIELFHRLGKPILMFGQGIGPITDPGLLQRVRIGLSRVSFIAIREPVITRPLLKQLGVPDKRVFLTGDDAVELAYGDAPLGGAIGVSLRLAQYACIDGDQIVPLRDTLYRLGEKYQVELLPLPVSHNSDQDDVAAIRDLMQGFCDTDGGKSIDTPKKLISQIIRCRIVITGSYHAGVFALARGIPVIGIYKSPYYRGKFDGLIAQFGAGCEAIALDDVPDQLEARVERLWQAAESLKPDLLCAARQQIEQGRAAYREAARIITEIVR